MTRDPHREANRDYQRRAKLLSDQQEESVINYFAAKGYSVLSWGDEGEQLTRVFFDMPDRGVKAADIVAQVSPTHAIIAEVKSTEFDKAIRQLHGTVPYVRKRFLHVACKVFTSGPSPTGDSTGLRGGNFSTKGYRAIRILHGGFPAEWPVMIIKDDGSEEFLRLGDEVVTVIFWPEPSKDITLAWTVDEYQKPEG